MKLSELKPCDMCGGPVAPFFYIIKADVAVLNQSKANQVLGLFQQFDRKSLPLAEALAADADGAVVVTPSDLKIFMCRSCGAKLLRLDPKIVNDITPQVEL